jgi:hypothetical protein
MLEKDAMRQGTLFFALSLAMLASQAFLPGQQPKEGVVRPDGIKWLHPLDAALPAGGKSDRPIILYFTFDT